MAYLHFFDIIIIKYNIINKKYNTYIPIKFIGIICFIKIKIINLYHHKTKSMLLDLHFARKKSPEKDTTPKESISRSALKAISWRLVGTFDTILIAYFITGTISQALSIGFIEWGTKIVLYFIHERLWNRLRWEKNN